MKLVKGNGQSSLVIRHRDPPTHARRGHPLCGPLTVPHTVTISQPAAGARNGAPHMVGSPLTGYLKVNEGKE